MAKHYATVLDLIVNCYYDGAKYTVYELVTRFNHVVDIDGNKTDGYALALRRGDVGTYAQSLPLRTFPTVAAARNACRNAFAIEPARGLEYINS